MSSMRQPVVMKQRSDEPRKRSSAPGDPGWRILTGLGIALAVIGWTDVVLGWFPLQFGSAEWEFGTISTTFDGLPLAAIGMTLLALGASVVGGRRSRRVAAIGLWTVAAFLATLFAIYVTDLPLALQGAGDSLRSTLLRAIIRTSTFAVVYLSFFSWLGWFTWKRSSKAKRTRERQ
ncbi:MAG: hypothetical protein ACOC8B_04975 [Gemmatimonadota bacterium]